MRPHGLDLILKEELLDNGNVVHSSIKPQNSLEGWISLHNKRNGKYIEFPMRSFVTTFINKLHGILSGDEGEDTKITSASCATAASSVNKSGLLLGTGTTPPGLSDSALETLVSDASFSAAFHLRILPPC